MPTVPTPETVLRVRFAMVTMIRVVAAAIVLWWVAQTTHRLLGTYVLGQKNAALVRAGFMPKEPVFEPIALAAVLPLCASVFAFIAPAIMKRLVPFPRPGCPFCDHEALPETGSRCPECGRELPEQLRR